MKTFLKVGYLIPVIFVLSCSVFESEDLNTSTEINIYLIKDGQLDGTENDVNIYSLELEEFPWVKHSDIAFYDWSSHIFYLNIEKAKSENERRYFMVTSNNNRLFYGIFFPMYMSSIPQVPSIVAHDDLFYPKDVLGLGGYGFQQSIDIMDDNFGFKEELEKAGLLHDGINVELLGVNKVNATSVEYTFKVINLDTENLYILDPDKMGSSRYHYYTNGVSLYDGKNYYFAQNMSYTSSDRILTEWYYKLSPGQSMIRTVGMDGFSSIPTGNTEATFTFPGSNIQAGEWKKQDGRIWLGNIRTTRELSVH